MGIFLLSICSIAIIIIFVSMWKGMTKDYDDKEKKS